MGAEKSGILTLFDDIQYGFGSKTLIRLAWQVLPKGDNVCKLRKNML